MDEPEVARILRGLTSGMPSTILMKEAPSLAPSMRLDAPHRVFSWGTSSEGMSFPDGEVEGWDDLPPGVEFFCVATGYADTLQCYVLRAQEVDVFGEKTYGITAKYIEDLIGDLDLEPGPCGCEDAPDCGCDNDGDW